MNNCDNKENNDKIKKEASIPADMITMIATYFTKANDLISLSLVCKRYHQILIRPLSDTNSPQVKLLLSLAFANIVALRVTPGTSIYRVLLTAAGYSGFHGLYQEWQMILADEDEDSFLQQMALYIASSQASSSSPALQFLEKTFSFVYILFAGGQPGVQTLLRQYGADLVRQVHYELGLQEGDETEFYCETSEQVKYIGHWSQGKLDGQQMWFSRNGTLKESITWKNGEKHGPREMWTHSGELTFREIFTHGVSDTPEPPKPTPVTNSPLKQRECILS